MNQASVDVYLRENKEFGSQLLISETVWQAVSDKFDDATSIGAVHVKGREAPIQLWQVV